MVVWWSKPRAHHHTQHNTAHSTSVWRTRRRGCERSSSEKEEKSLIDLYALDGKWDVSVVAVAAENSQHETKWCTPPRWMYRRWSNTRRSFQIIWVLIEAGWKIGICICIEHLFVYRRRRAICHKQQISVKWTAGGSTGLCFGCECY